MMAALSIILHLFFGAGSVGRARRNRVFRSTPSDPMNSERTMEMELATWVGRSSICCIHPAGEGLQEEQEDGKTIRDTLLH
ncbi:unnamed protein product [Cuscuta campestris]|uniref:Secreted protein n=1 Tax=Cuscuta campestris TaxID=132261 RepID=A0A484MP48_9ASTE|nr:unnamed protein product [Cuscuta campestris]